MRIRSIHPEFYRSEDVAALSWAARLVFIGLWSYVDDNGVGRDNERLIIAELFPLEEDPRDTLATVSDALAALSDGGQIVRYEVGSKRYLHIVSWKKWQKIDKPGKERYPLPTREDAVVIEALATRSRDSSETPVPGEGEKGRRGEVQTPSESAPRKRGTRLPDAWAPSVELRQQMADQCPTVDQHAEYLKFCDFWRAKTGKDATKLDWDATYRNWMRRAAEQQPRGRPGRQQATDDLFDRAAHRLGIAQ